MSIKRMLGLAAIWANLSWVCLVACAGMGALTTIPPNPSQQLVSAALSTTSPTPSFAAKPSVVLRVSPKSWFAWFSRESKIVFQKGEWFVAAAPTFSPQRLPVGSEEVRLWAGSIPLVSSNDSFVAFNATRTIDDTESLWRMLSDGSELHDILPGELAQTGTSNAKEPLRWQSSNSFFYQTHCGSGCEELWLISMPSGKPEKVVGGEGARFVAGALAYDVSPKGDKVVVTGGGDYALYIADLTRGQNLELVGSRGLGLQEFQSWTPNQAQFFYTQWSGFFPLDKEFPSLYLWDSNQHKSDLFIRTATQAAVSPMGDFIAFLLLGNPNYDRQGRIIDTSWQPKRTPMMNLVILARDTKRPLMVIPLGLAHNVPKLFGSSFFRPTWSPDGKQLAYRDVGKNVWILDLARKSNKLITPAPESSQIAWSFDGKWLAIGQKDRILIYDRVSLIQ